MFEDYLPDSSAALMPAGKRLLRDIHTLPTLLKLAEKTAFLAVVSPRGIEELDTSGGSHAIDWATQMVEYSLENLREAGEADRTELLYTKSEALAESNFLSFLPQRTDRLMVADALCLGCDGFLTTDYRTILKFKSQLFKSTGLTAFSPYEYWKVLRKWAALYL